MNNTISGNCVTNTLNDKVKFRRGPYMAEGVYGTRIVENVSFNEGWL